MTNKNIIVCDQQRNGIVHMTIDQQKNSITHKPTKNYINKQLSKIYNRPIQRNGIVHMTNNKMVQYRLHQHEGYYFT